MFLLAEELLIRAGAEVLQSRGASGRLSRRHRSNAWGWPGCQAKGEVRVRAGTAQAREPLPRGVSAADALPCRRASWP